MIKILGLTIRNSKNERELMFDINSVISSNTLLSHQLSDLKKKNKELTNQILELKSQAEKDSQILEERYLDEREAKRKLQVKYDNFSINRNTLLSYIKKYKQFNKKYLYSLIDSLEVSDIFIKRIKNIDKSQNKVMKEGAKND